MIEYPLRDIQGKTPEDEFKALLSLKRSAQGCCCLSVSQQLIYHKAKKGDYTQTNAGGGKVAHEDGEDDDRHRLAITMPMHKWLRNALTALRV